VFGEDVVGGVAMELRHRMRTGGGDQLSDAQKGQLQIAAVVALCDIAESLQKLAAK
jgi:hypothetical protein